MPQSKPYNDYSSYLKAKYGSKVYTIGIDAGFTCPNRDGTTGRGGCVYCGDNGSRSSYADPKKSIGAQLAARIKYLKEKRDAERFIAYFQAFTNTHAPLETLKRRYDEILPFKEVVGLSIGTRPDAVDKDKLQLISSYKARYEVWMEYGVQSSHDKTLKSINRGHTYNDFVDAVNMTKVFQIPICAHVILGLIGETREDMIETARRISGLGIEGIKIHLLHVLRGSALERSYNEGKIKLLTLDEYAGLACDFLENLSPEIVVKRITGQGPAKSHIAPEWALDKTATINRIGEIFNDRGSCQGYRLTANGKKPPAIIS